MWPTNDMTYYIAKAITLWSVPELVCSVLVPCLPILPQFFKMIRRKNASPAKKMVQITPSSEGKRVRHLPFDRESQAIRKTTETMITDIEYHELMNSDMMDNMDMEYITPWIKQPDHVKRAPVKVSRRTGTVSRLAGTVQ